MNEHTGSATREAEMLIQEISEMAGHISRRFIPNAEKRRLFEAAIPATYTDSDPVASQEKTTHQT